VKENRNTTNKLRKAGKEKPRKRHKNITEKGRGA
jgi:hypothetical protein